MITITSKTDCCGCEACASRCVTSCIIMTPDEEGFSYPVVDTGKCIHCGLCERVCPLLHKPQPHEILSVIGCKNKNEAVRFVSSSGGFFRWLPSRFSHVRASFSALPLTKTGRFAILLLQTANPSLNCVVPNMCKAISTLLIRKQRNCSKQIIPFYLVVHPARSVA